MDPCRSLRPLSLLAVTPIQKYGALWPAENDALQIEMAAIRLGGTWRNKRGEECGRGLPFHYEQMRRILWPHLDGEHNGQRWHVLTRNEILKNKVTCLMGAGCVKNTTRIPDPITGRSNTVGYLHKNRIAPTVMTLYGPMPASIPFIKGYTDLVEIRLSNGASFWATEQHRVLTDQGFAHVSELKIGQCLFSYARCRPCSISEPSRSTRLANAVCFPKTTASLKDHCFACSHHDDEPPHWGVNTVPSAFPSQADARRRTACVSCGADVMECESKHIRLYQQFDHLSNCSVCQQPQISGIVSSPHFAAERQARVFDLCRFSLRSLSGKIPLHRAEEPNPCCVDTRQFGYEVSVSRVTHISRTHKDVYYDISVPWAEHYFAEGAIHHNSTGKTHSAAWIYLCDYLCHPDDTVVLVSSTDIRGLKLRVWGEITMLWSMAVERFDYLPGHLLDSKLAITTDRLLDDDGDIDDRRVRDMRKGIIGIPTIQGGKQVGLSKWIGIKQKRVRLIADECQCMGSGFLSAFSNLNKNEDFRAIVLGNPNDMMDPLGRAAEPLDGWSSHMEPEKTSVWKTRFMNGTCVNLVGTDSPNFDFPPEQPTRFKYLISREKIADTVSFFGRDSFEYFSQCIGVMKIGTMARRVLSRQLCEQQGALETEINWDGSPRTRLYFVDSAYGGDRCVGGWAEFGRCVDEKTRLLLHPPVIIPISPRSDKEPEYQIAEFVKRECEGNSIEPHNMGHDATGRGSLGTALARVWSAYTNPIEAGGPPTDRPVSLDLYVWDSKKRERRLKTCQEHYVKLVTEFWFSVRYCIEAGQLRGLTEETMEEFCMREWRRVKDNKIEIETKQEMKERVGRSPDLADWCAGIVEMARRRGFQISKLASSASTENNRQWLHDLRRKQEKMLRGKQLDYAV